MIQLRPCRFCGDDRERSLRATLLSAKCYVAIQKNCLRAATCAVEGASNEARAFLWVETEDGWRAEHVSVRQWVCKLVRSLSAQSDAAASWLADRQTTTELPSSGPS